MVTKGIVAGEREQTYKVVVVLDPEHLARVTNRHLVTVTNRHLQKIEIYDSYEKSWSVETYIPENLRVSRRTMVLSDGCYLYCEAMFYWGCRTLLGCKALLVLICKTAMPSLL